MRWVVRGLAAAAFGAALGALFGWLNVRSSTFTVCSVGESTCPPWVNLDGRELTVTEALATEIPIRAAWGAVVGLLFWLIAHKAPMLVRSVTIVAIVMLGMASICELEGPKPGEVDLCTPFVFGIGSLVLLPVALIAFIVDVRRHLAKRKAMLRPPSPRPDPSP